MGGHRLSFASDGIAQHAACGADFFKDLLSRCGAKKRPEREDPEVGEVDLDRFPLATPEREVKGMCFVISGNTAPNTSGAKTRYLRQA
jgi:hypothetical protein